jgi:hypothetical protein
VSSWLRSSALLVALSFASASIPADDAVRVTAIRHPVDKSYRKMVSGMDLFEQMHALAPDATLRYRLYPRKRGTDMGIGAVYVVGDQVDVPIAVAADNTFTLRRDLPEDAVVRSERRADTMTWRADIRTPRLPPHTRRLGDLRLECLVGMQAGLVSQYPNFLSQLFRFLERPREFCGRAEVPYLFFADRPVFAVTLHAGERRRTVSVGNLYAGIAHGRTPEDERKYCDCEALLDRAYTLPLGDSSWPDDTLVELQYMQPAPATDAYGALIGSTKSDIRAAFGSAKVLSFDSGYEVWAYDFGSMQKPALEREELVLLFDRSDTVIAARHRE